MYDADSRLSRKRPTGVLATAALPVTAVSGEGFFGG